MSHVKKLTSRQVLYAKQETTPGTDAGCTTDDAVMMLSGASVSPSGEKVGDDRLSAFIGKKSHSMSQFVTGYTGKHELRGMGITGSQVAKPEIDAMLQGCAMAVEAAEFVATGAATGTFEFGETVTGGTSSAYGLLIGFVDEGDVLGVLLYAVSGTFESGEVLTGGDSGATATSSAVAVDCWAYHPQSYPDLMKTFTFERYLSGGKFPGLGTMATFSLALEVGQRGLLEFALSARYVRPSEVTHPTPTLSDSLAPTVNGIGLALGAYEPVGVTSLGFVLGNTVTVLKDVNASDGILQYAVTDRTPTASLDPLADSLDKWNPYQEWEEGSLASVAALVGTDAGNRVYVCAPAVQHASAPGEAERDGFAQYSLALEPKMVDGDDDLWLVWF